MSVTQRDTDVYICYFCKISHDLISSSLVQFFFFLGGGGIIVSQIILFIPYGGLVCVTLLINN